MFTYAIPQLFSAADTDAIRALALRAGSAPAALVGGRNLHNVRTAQICWLADGADSEWIRIRFAEAVAAANRACFGFDLDGFDEQLQVAIYPAASAGHFDWHADIGDAPLARRRKLTIVAQLSPPASYEGGSLEINALGHAQPSSRGLGDAVVFASFVLHRVTPVTHGSRASLTSWVHGPALR